MHDNLPAAKRLSTCCRNTSSDGAVTGLGDRLFMSLVGVAIIDLNLKFAGPRVALSVQITCCGIQIFVNGIILQNAWLNYYNPNI